MNSAEFRATRQALGLSQTELADRLGMTQPMVSRIERGERQPTVQQGAAILLLAELMKKENWQGKNFSRLPVTNNTTSQCRVIPARRTP